MRRIQNLDVMMVWVAIFKENAQFRARRKKISIKQNLE
jgi:hypothetical protein